MTHDRLRRGDRELVGVIAEDVLDRLRLRQVAERRRCAVCVDVVDVFWRKVGAAQCCAHHLGYSNGLGIRRRHVVRVVRGAVTDHLGVDRRASRQRRVRVLQHEYTGPLADHKTGASGVEGTRGTRRMLLLRHESAHGTEAGEDERMHASLGPAGEHCVSVATTDQLGGLAHGM
jgi:hypothetical protein